MKNEELKKDMLDELSEDELTDLELDPVSGGLVARYIVFEPEFIQVKRPKPPVKAL